MRRVGSMWGKMEFYRELKLGVGEGKERFVIIEFFFGVLDYLFFILGRMIYFLVV